MSEPDFRQLVEEAERLYDAEGRSTEALQTIERALRLRSRDPHALVVKGRISFSLGRTREAWRIYTRAATLAPRSAEPALERARVLWALKGDHVRALKETVKALSYSRGDKWIRIESLRLQGHIFVALDQDDKAIKAYRSALRLQPRDPSLLADIGKTVLLHGQPNQALRYLERALQLVGNLDSRDRDERDFMIVAKAEALAALERNWDVLRVVRTELRHLRDPLARHFLSKVAKKAKEIVTTSASRSGQQRRSDRVRNARLTPNSKR